MHRRFFRIVIFLLVLLVGIGVFVFLNTRPSESYTKNSSTNDKTAQISEEKSVPPKPKIAQHIKEPEAVKGIYMTAWVAGSRNTAGEFYWRDALAKLIDDTELNAIVIDIKDDTGRISFETTSAEVQKFDTGTTRIPDLEAMIEMFHQKGIYVIGRIAIFQDPHLVSVRPDLALRRISDGGVWKDRRGLSWLDASSREVWDYVAAIGKEAYARGFDEIQFDYLRFPTDGNVKDIAYPFFDAATQTKADVITSFVTHAHTAFSKEGVPFSIDVFGQTTTAPDDMGIGQVFGRLILVSDAISPMVYPSHYGAGYAGYENPNEHVYEILKYALGEAVNRAVAASTTPQKIRPWLQDFDYGGNYDAAKVRAQIQAVEDVGLDSWILWDPANKYTTEALKPNI